MTTLTLFSILFAAPAGAAPVIATCPAGTAPGAFVGQSCNGTCTWNAGTNELTCSLQTNACTGQAAGGSPDQVTAVHDWNNAGLAHFTAYGLCTNGGVQTSWCCAINDNAPNPEIAKLIVDGTTGVDTLSLFDGATGDVLRNHRAAFFDATVNGDDGNDTIIGSSFTGAAYSEILNGDGGDDTILAQDGDDFIDGGDGDDSIFGNTGDDAISGGDGTDYIEGGNGHDTICDTDEDASGCTANEIHAGAGNDTLWIQYNGNSCPYAHSASDMGAGVTETCGDASVGAFGSTPWPDCDVDLTTAPTCP